MVQLHTQYTSVLSVRPEILHKPSFPAETASHWLPLRAPQDDNQHRNMGLFFFNKQDAQSLIDKARKFPKYTCLPAASQADVVSAMADGKSRSAFNW